MSSYVGLFLVASERVMEDPVRSSVAECDLSLVVVGVGVRVRTAVLDDSLFGALLVFCAHPCTASCRIPS